MKCLVFALTATAVIAVFAQSAQPPPLPVNPGSRLRNRLAQKAGGYVYQHKDGKALKIVNCNGATDKAILANAADSIADLVLVKTVIADGSFDASTLADDSAGAWVFVEDNAENPALLVAPEEAWARINVRRLKADSPDAKKLNARIVKEIWRGAAIAMGGSDAQMQPSLMRSIKNLKMLDVAPPIPTPETFNKIMTFSKDRDFGTVTKATYRAACKEGWAPAPTNDLQRKIWDQVHEIPTSPLKIKYDPKRDK